MAVIDIGPGASERPEYLTAGSTVIDKNNPANLSGRITEVKLWANSIMGSVEVGIFTQVDTDIFTSRSNSLLNSGNNVPIGLQTYAVNLAVEAGDFIGLYWVGGGIKRNDAGYLGNWYKTGDNIPCTATSFGFSASRALALEGSGTDILAGGSAAVAIAVVTIGAI